ncbi:MAG: hypothetical protein LUF89_06580 [Ruminococcus sp.]|nr:hypothetical protein [Ruminococcus sp.]
MTLYHDYENARINYECALEYYQYCLNENKIDEEIADAVEYLENAETTLEEAKAALNADSFDENSAYEISSVDMIIQAIALKDDITEALPNANIDIYWEVIEIAIFLDSDEIDLLSDIVISNDVEADLIGDINLDGNISISDVVCLSKYTVGSVELNAQ